MIMFSFQELSSKPDMKMQFQYSSGGSIYILKKKGHILFLCVCVFKKLYLNYIQMKVATEQHQIIMIGYFM